MRKHWTTRFLAELRKSGNITEAAGFAGIKRRKIYYRQTQDAEFARLVQEARVEGENTLADTLIAQAHRRAMAPAALDKAGHILLMFALKKLRPEYRDSYQAPAPAAQDYFLDLHSDGSLPEGEPDQSV